MNKLIICIGQENDSYSGIGKTILNAFADYTQQAGGEDGITECKFYEAEEIEIEFTIKRKETAASAARK